MASATADHRQRHHNRLHLESIPVVDLRLLSQPELLSLSVCSSSHSPSLSNAETELLTPKIDRSVFNESAGSRKQTFFRLRLASPRNHLHYHHSSSPSKPFPSRPIRPDPEPFDEESSSILPLLKSLFDIDDLLTDNTNEREPYDDNDLVPVQIEYRKGNSVLQSIPVSIVSASVRKRKRGRPRKDEIDNWLIESESLAIEEYKETSMFERVNEGNVSSFSEGKRRRGRPRKEESQSRVIGSEEKKVESEIERVNEGNISSFSEGKRRRGRPRKEESQSRVIGSEEKKVESEFERIAMGNVEAILGIEEELRKKTEGLRTKEELLEFMGGLEGEWASKSQRKRIIDASSFGSVLPKGWKLMLFVKKRTSHFWLACSRYISPNGQQFVSSKEVSSYLLSYTGLKDSSMSTSCQTGCGISSGVKPTAGNFPVTSVSSGYEKQASLLRMGSPSEVRRDETIKCHKCSMAFNQQDDLVCHLLSSHQGTEKISGHGTPTNEEVIIKNGKYKCQFCHELFEERNCYSGHLGIHMKNGTMKVEGSVAVLTVQNSIQPFNSPGNNEIISGCPCHIANESALVKTYTDRYCHECNSVSPDEQDIKVNRNEETLADKNCDKQNKFCIITNNKGKATDTDTAAAAAPAQVNVSLGSDNVLFTADESGVSQSSDKTDVRFAVNSVEEKKIVMASKTSLLAPNAEGNMFSDENVEGIHFNLMKGIETDWKDKVMGDDPKAGSASTHTGSDNTTIDVGQKKYSEGCSVFLSNNKQGSNLLDHVEGASVRIDYAEERVSGSGLTSSKVDQTCVNDNNLVLVSTGRLDDPESFMGCESANHNSTIGFQSNLVKKPSQDSESALLAVHGREQMVPSDNNAFKVSRQTFEMSELDEAQMSGGLIQGVDSHESGLDANILASVKHERTKDCLFAQSSYKNTFTGKVGEHKDKACESTVNEQSAYQQYTNYETSMDKVSLVTREEPKHKVESYLFGNAHSRLDTFSCSPIFPGSGEIFAGKNNVPGTSSGSVHALKKNKGAFEDLFCLSGREQTHVANNSSMVYAGTAYDGSRLEDFENARNNEIRIGFSNHSRSTEDSMAGLTWKNDDGNVLLSGLADTSSQLLQPSGYHPTFDLMSHKGESEMFNISGKCSSVTSFEGLGSGSIENMEFDFLTAQPSSRSGNSEMALKFDSSDWLEKEALPLFPKIAGRHQVPTLCSWCGTEFYHEAVDSGTQRSSMVMCGNCQDIFCRNHDFM